MGQAPNSSTDLFSPRHPRGLLERDGELALVEELFVGTRERRGGILVIEGPAGIGKSRLLAAAAELAPGRGLEVLRARAGELERAFAYRVVRQLFEPTLARAPARDRAELVGGAAQLAAPLFDVAETSTGPVDVSFGTLHGLFWLTSKLAERAPLLLAVDDLHWCDPPSLRFLAYLVRRLEGLPVLIVGTVHPGERGAEEELLQDLGADPLRLSPVQRHSAARPSPTSLRRRSANPSRRLRARCTKHAPAIRSSWASS